MGRYASIVILLFFQAINEGQAAPQPSFNLEKLNLKVGMKRSVLENNIAKYTEVKSNYSTQYPTESPTNKSYTIKTVILHVTYKEGIPAPYVSYSGKVSHLQAIEQTVLSWGVDE